ncbi:MAG: LprI family protein [Candidatus Obscuribacterales bacterium]|nr:LprI family protein [Candidatus Obscuribacterales bacterium]
MSDRNIGTAVENAKNNTNKLQNDSVQCRENSDEAGMQKCDQKFTVLWDKQLNENYKALTSSLSPDGKALLQDAERKWIAFDNTELGMGKHMRSPAAGIFDKEELIADRTKQLLSRFGKDDLPDHVPDLDSIDKRLNTTYQQVKANLSPEQQKDLVASERKWVAFKDAEFKLIDHLNPQPEDGGRNVRNTVEKAQLLLDRDRELRILAADIGRPANK